MDKKKRALSLGLAAAQLAALTPMTSIVSRVAYAAEQPAAPTAVISYTDEKLTGLTESATYSVTVNKAASDKSAASDGTLTIDDSWYGKTISIAKKDGDITGVAQEITIPSRPAAPTFDDFTITNATSTNNNGSISTTTPNLEYSTTSGGSYTSYTNAIKNLAKDAKYYFRVKATDSNFKSAELEIKINKQAEDDITVSSPAKAQINAALAGNQNNEFDTSYAKWSGNLALVDDINMTGTTITVKARVGAMSESSNSGVGKAFPIVVDLSAAASNGYDIDRDGRPRGENNERVTEAWKYANKKSKDDYTNDKCVIWLSEAWLGAGHTISFDNQNYYTIKVEDITTYDLTTKITNVDVTIEMNGTTSNAYTAAKLGDSYKVSVSAADGYFFESTAASALTGDGYALNETTGAYEKIVTVDNTLVGGARENDDANPTSDMKLAANKIVPDITASAITAPKVNINYTNEELTVDAINITDAKIMYKKNDAAEWTEYTNAISLTDDLNVGVSYTFKTFIGDNGSVEVKKEDLKRPDAPTMNCEVTNASAAGETDGQINITSPTATTLEYAKSKDAATWTLVSSSTITNLADGDYYFRVAAVTSGSGSFRSAPTDSPVSVSIKAKETAPTEDEILAMITSYTDEKITVPATYEWGDAENNLSAGTGEAAAVEPGKTYYFVRKATNAATHTDSDPVAITIPARPAAPSVTISTLSEGKVILTGSTTAMEYKVSGGYADCTANMEVDSLSGGETIKVRTKATSSAFASEEIELPVSENATALVSATVENPTDAVYTGAALTGTAKITLKNTGTGNAECTVTLPTGVSGATFTLADGATSPVTVEAGKTVTLNVTIEATNANNEAAYTGDATITYKKTASAATDETETAALSFTIKKATPEITLTSDKDSVGSFAEGETDANKVTVTVTGIDSACGETITYTLTAPDNSATSPTATDGKIVFTVASVGTYKLKAAVTGTDNVNAADSNEILVSVVDEAETVSATVTAGALTNDSLVYRGSERTATSTITVNNTGNTTKTFTLTTTGGTLSANSVTLAAGASGTVTLTISGTDAGEYKAKVTATTGTYTAESSELTFTITKAPQTKPLAPSGTYDATTKKITVSCATTDAVFALSTSNSTAPTSGYGAAPLTPSANGTYYVWAMLPETTNYEASEAVVSTTSVEVTGITSNNNNNNNNNNSNNTSNSTGGGPVNTEPTLSNGKSGWSSISSDVKKAKDGDTIAVELNGATTVPTSVLTAAKGKDVTLEFKVNATYTWEINGKDIKSDKDAINITVGQANISKEALLVDGIKGSKLTKSFKLSNAPFGVNATLKATVGAGYKDNFANLYKLDAATGKLVFAGVTKIDKNGNAIIPVTENGSYVIVIDKETKMLGDLDNSMGLSPKDALEMLKDVVGRNKTKAGLYKADINGDGKETARDALEILKLITSGKA